MLFGLARQVAGFAVSTEPMVTVPELLDILTTMLRIYCFVKYFHDDYAVGAPCMV